MREGQEKLSKTWRLASPYPPGSLASHRQGELTGWGMDLGLRAQRNQDRRGTQRLQGHQAWSLAREYGSHLKKKGVWTGGAKGCPRAMPRAPREGREVPSTSEGHREQLPLSAGLGTEDMKGEGWEWPQSR